MSRVVVIGNANIDILAQSEKQIIPNDSNPGNVKMVSGGVAHNIACNLRNLNVPIEFVTAFSTDSFGQMLFRECSLKQMKLDNCQFFDNYPSSCYVAIVDETGEMNVAVCDSGIIDHLDIVKIYPLLYSLTEQDVLLLDTNMCKEKLYEIISHTKAKIICDPISVTKGLKVKDFLGNFFVFKPNYLESVEISGLDNPTDRELLDYYILKGVNQIVISKGADGVIGSDGIHYYHVETCAKNIVSTNGAGDSFTAGYLYAYLKDIPFVGRLIIAQVCASLTISSYNTVSELLDEEMVKQTFDIVKRTIKVEEL